MPKAEDSPELTGMCDCGTTLDATAEFCVSCGRLAPGARPGSSGASDLPLAGIGVTQSLPPDTARSLLAKARGSAPRGAHKSRPVDLPRKRRTRLSRGIVAIYVAAMLVPIAGVVATAVWVAGAPAPENVAPMGGTPALAVDGNTAPTPGGAAPFDLGRADRWRPAPPPLDKPMPAPSPRGEE